MNLDKILRQVQARKATKATPTKRGTLFDVHAFEALASKHADKLEILFDEDDRPDAMCVGMGIPTLDVSGRDSRHPYLARGCKRAPGTSVTLREHK